MFPRSHGEEGVTMPDEDDLERRLWRTMPWDASVMEPKDDEEGDED